jgi:hypothetical protein
VPADVYAQVLLLGELADPMLREGEAARIRRVVLLALQELFRQAEAEVPELRALRERQRREKQKTQAEKHNTSKIVRVARGLSIIERHYPGGRKIESGVPIGSAQFSVEQRMHLERMRAAAAAAETPVGPPASLQKKR